MPRAPAAASCTAVTYARTASPGTRLGGRRTAAIRCARVLGRTFGGVWTMLGLKALERAELARLGHFSESPDALEVVTRTIRQLWESTWVLDHRLLEDDEFVHAHLSAEYGERLWKRIGDRLPTRGRPRPDRTATT